MGVRLIVEVLDRVPGEVTTAERLLLVALAEKADDATRRVVWSRNDGDRRELLARRVGVRPETVGKLLSKLAGRGLEARVPLGTDSRGRTVFAHEGRVADFLVPVLPAAERSHEDATTERSHESPTTDPEVARSSVRGGTEVPPLERERSHEDATLVPSFPQIPSIDLRTRDLPDGHVDAVAAVLARHGGHIDEDQALDALAGIEAWAKRKRDPIVDMVRFVNSRTREDLESFAAKGRTAPAPDVEKCPHGMVNGLQVYGAGSGASRRCGQCEAVDPAEARTRPVTATTRGGEIDWTAAGNRAAARDAAAAAAEAAS